MKPSLTHERSPAGPPPLHGGDRSPLHALAEIPEAGWLDLSTGVNPWPYPLVEATAESWRRLPEAAAETVFAEAARRYYGLDGAAALAAAPGSQALIQWLPRLLPPRRVAVLGFTYKEHARAWAAAGHEVAETEDGRLPEAAEIAVLVNPNNPDGARRTPAELAALAGRLRRRGGLLVVDEAFADLDPEGSLAGLDDLRGLVVLRSFGKFFGLAGVRLGFAICLPEMAARIANWFGPWAISGPALEIGTAALGNAKWHEQMREQLAQQSSI
ncbi:MAG: aminotransferase class I/II-fold pyridoxal phosphate-dependent enzyme, partial [Tistlia sp.]